MIGDLIEITIVDIRGDKVRLGITAPLSIPVHRKEVYEAIQNENRAASNVRVADVSELEQMIHRPADDAASTPGTVTGAGGRSQAPATRQ